MKASYTENDFRLAVSNNTSMSAVLLALGLRLAGGNFRAANERIRLLGLDTSHWTKQGYLKGKTHNWAKRTPLDEVLVANKPYNTATLRKRLVKEGIMEDKCSKCGHTGDWNFSPLVLQLDHINGDSMDNRIENLRILCPNCHSQTSNWGGRNAEHRKIPARVCPCGAVISRGSTRCVTCAQQSRRKATISP